jgi:hypothetical protein
MYWFCSIKVSVPGIRFQAPRIGFQVFRRPAACTERHWTPAFAGVTAVYENGDLLSVSAGRSASSVTAVYENGDTFLMP